MVKGVNKTVIEISDTGNEIFEKVVLYIKPQYQNLNSKKIKNETEKILQDYSFDDFSECSVKESGPNKKIVLYLFAASIVAVAAILGVLIF